MRLKFRNMSPSALHALQFATLLLDFRFVIQVVFIVALSHFHIRTDSTVLIII